MFTVAYVPEPPTYRVVVFRGNRLHYLPLEEGEGTGATSSTPRIMATQRPSLAKVPMDPNTQAAGSAKRADREPNAKLVSILGNMLKTKTYGTTRRSTLGIAKTSQHLRMKG